MSVERNYLSKAEIIMAHGNSNDKPHPKRIAWLLEIMAHGNSESLTVRSQVSTKTVVKTEELSESELEG